MSENFTNEGIEVKVGQVWRDLDKRKNNRQIVVVLALNAKANVAPFVNGQRQRRGRQTTLSINRMHKHSTGWALMQDVTQPEGESHDR